MIWFGVAMAVFATVLEGFGQVYLKKSALAGGHKLMVAIGLAFFVVEALIYTGALHYLDVSVAYPIGSLSFVAVVILSKVMLHERIDASRWIGIVLIIAGAGLVALRA